LVSCLKRGLPRPHSFQHIPFLWPVSAPRIQAPSAHDFAADPVARNGPRRTGIMQLACLLLTVLKSARATNVSADELGFIPSPVDLRVPVDVVRSHATTQILFESARDVVIKRSACVR